MIRLDVKYQNRIVECKLKEFGKGESYHASFPNVEQPYKRKDIHFTQRFHKADGNWKAQWDFSYYEGSRVAMKMPSEVENQILDYLSSKYP